MYLLLPEAGRVSFMEINDASNTKSSCFVAYQFQSPEAALSSGAVPCSWSCHQQRLLRCCCSLICPHYQRCFFSSHSYFIVDSSCPFPALYTHLLMFRNHNTALEPFFNAAATQFVLGQQVPLSLWLSLAPVVIGNSQLSPLILYAS